MLMPGSRIDALVDLHADIHATIDVLGTTERVNIGGKPARIALQDVVEQLWVDRRVQADLALGTLSGSVIRDEACTLTAVVADPIVSRRRDICVEPTASAVGATLGHLRDDSCGPVQAGGSS